MPSHAVSDGTGAPAKAQAAPDAKPRLTTAGLLVWRPREAVVAVAGRGRWWRWWWGRGPVVAVAAAPREPAAGAVKRRRAIASPQYVASQCQSQRRGLNRSVKQPQCKCNWRQPKHQQA
jgi:hypothetical protein